MAAAAREGDPVACAAMAELARWLGEGLALVADVFDPELMVIGGGVSESAPLFLDEAREHYADRHRAGQPPAGPGPRRAARRGGGGGGGGGAGPGGAGRPLTATELGR